MLKASRPPMAGNDALAPPTVRYHTAAIDGVDIFYREAGPADAPVVLLLHGFPSSSHQYRNLTSSDGLRILIPGTADRRSRPNV